MYTCTLVWCVVVSVCSGDVSVVWMIRVVTFLCDVVVFFFKQKTAYEI